MYANSSRYAYHEAIRFAFNFNFRRKTLWALQFTLQRLHVATPAIVDTSIVVLSRCVTRVNFLTVAMSAPPLNAQYEVVQPDLHSLERYDFSKEPDLPWYP